MPQTPVQSFNYTPVIAEILTIIGHTKEDVDKYSPMLFMLCVHRSLTYLLLEKSDEEREQLHSTLGHISDLGLFFKTLSDHFELKTIEKAFQKGTSEALHTYLETVYTNLSDAQKLSITKVISKHLKEQNG